MRNPWKIVAAVLLPLACTAHAKDKLVIQQYQGTYGNAAAVVAARTGICEQQGLDCEIKYINSGPLGLQALVGKSIDVAFVGTDTLVTGIARGAKIQLVYAGYQPLTLSFVARNDLALAKGSVKDTLDQLKGKRIGVTQRGAQTELHFLSLAQAAGLKAGDFTLVPVGGPATAYTALTAGRNVDAMMIMNPLKQICVVAKTCQLVFDADTVDWPPELKAMSGASVTMAMRTETIEGNPELVKRFIQAMAQANAWIRDPKNRAAVVELLGPTMTLGDIPNAEGVRQRWIENDIAQMGDGRISRPAVQGIVDYLAGQGLIDAKPAVASIVYGGAP